MEKKIINALFEPEYEQLEGDYLTLQALLDECHKNGVPALIEIGGLIGLDGTKPVKIIGSWDFVMSGWC